MGTRRTPASHRHDELKAMLERRKRELSSELNARKCDARTRNGAASQRNTERHVAEAGPHTDTERALIQLKSDTLHRLDAALRKLAQGTYGHCAECTEPISTERLRALPFAVRCTSCEERREATLRRRQPAEPRRAYVGIVTEISV